MSNALQANQLEELLQRDDLPDDVRDRLELVALNLRNAIAGELTPPNIRVDEPIPGRNPKADAARAEAPTGDLPRADIQPPPAPEDIVPPHEFGLPEHLQALQGRRRGGPSVADLNPEPPTPIIEQGERTHIPLPAVEHALP